MYICLATVFKNEQDRLREWLTYHYVCGVEKFVLVNDHSSDGSLDVIASVRERLPVEITVLNSLFENLGFNGSVDTLRYQGSDRLSEIITANFKRVYEMLRGQEAVIGYFDVDEFLYSYTGNVVSQVLRIFETPSTALVPLIDYQADPARFNAKKPWITQQSVAQTSDAERAAGPRSTTRKCFIRAQSPQFFTAGHYANPHNLGWSGDQSAVYLPGEELAFLHYRQHPYYVTSYTSTNESVRAVSAKARCLWP